MVHTEHTDESTGHIVGNYAKVVGLKKKNPELKVLLAVGGWKVGSAPFTAMVSGPASRAEFVKTSVKFLRNRGFDGLDLDWEYPAARGSPAGDKSKFTDLVKVFVVC